MNTNGNTESQAQASLYRLFPGFQGSKVDLGLFLLDFCGFCEILIGSLFFFLAAFTSVPALATESGEGIQILWKATLSEQPIRSWGASDILKLKRTVTREKDAESGRMVAWQGPLLSDFVKNAMKDLPLAQQAAFDLLIFRNRSGAHVALPRWLITRYPVILGTLSGSSKTSFRVVLPWTAKPSIRKEFLPLNTYGLEDISTIELASYDQVYSAFYLKKRSDPVAVKGEKLFVQDCAGCHASSAEGEASPMRTPLQTPQPLTTADLLSNARTRRLASEGHPRIPDAPELSDRERRALGAYLEAFQNENRVPPAPPESQAAHNP